MSQLISFFVGSKNPVKINSVKQAVTAHWPMAEVLGYEVESGIGAQPFTDEETRKGAEHRAKSALKKGLSDKDKNGKSSTNIGVGLEGGVFEQNGEMWSTVWCAVIDEEGHVFVSNGARLRVPDAIAARIRAGEEMGHAVQHLTGINNIKQKHGMLGVITENFVDRTEEYSAIAKLTIGLWFGRNWQQDLVQS